MEDLKSKLEDIVYRMRKELEAEATFIKMDLRQAIIKDTRVCEWRSYV